MKCPYCGLENPPLASRCDCGYNFRTDQPPPQGETTQRVTRPLPYGIITDEAPSRGDESSESSPHVNDRFPALSFISAFLRFIGWLIVVGGILVCVGSVINLMRATTAGWWEIIAIVAGLVITASGAVAVAVGESVGVLFAIETNTRLAAEKLSCLP